MRIGFAGAGNMAAAMARGWAGADQPPEAMVFVDAGSGRAAKLAKEVGGEAVADISDLPQRSDVIVLAVKPAAFDAVATELKGHAPALISVMAGVSGSRIEQAFPGVPTVLAMPNVAAEVRRGITCYVPPSGDDSANTEQLLDLLGRLGKLVPVEEHQIELAGAVMSCSPAYIALVSEALATAGEREGLDATLSHELVVDALAGTAELLRNRDPAAIRRAVASPGGATEAGLDALAARDLEAAIHEAVKASLERMRR
ncbi:MAG TPA: pyrroline-5-carboxylate reductase [Solirubrobacterales bacterium]|nr:pyrroline-5-carboxylate reductase [Solirubrobacterales bacterium]